VRHFQATLRAARLFGKFSQFCLANIFNITYIKMVKIFSKIQAAQFTIYVLAYPSLLFCTADPATKVQGDSNGNRDYLFQRNDRHGNFVILRGVAESHLIVRPCNYVQGDNV
jgi:hypothetical protein